MIGWFRDPFVSGDTSVRSDVELWLRRLVNIVDSCSVV